MYIFNQDKKPYLIITKDELLFRESPSDQDMQRYTFASIEKISLAQSHDTDKKRKQVTSLQIKIKETPEPLLVQISALNNSLEETLSIIKSSLDQQVPLSFPSQKPIKNRSKKHNYKILTLLAFVLLITGASLFHTLVPPTLQDLKPNYLKAIFKPDHSMCSVKATAAYQGRQKDLITVNNYCGLLGSWYKQSQKSIPKKYLETEFSQLTHSDYITKAKQDIDKKDYPSSITSLEKAIYLDPNDVQAYLILAQIYYLNGDRALAIENNHKALRLNPNSPEAHSALGLIYAEKENYPKAEEHYARSVQLQATAKGYLSLAEVELKLGKTDQAITHFEHSLKKDGNNTLVLSKLGLFYWENKSYKKAAKVFEKAYTLSPKEPSHFFNYYEISLIESTPLSTQAKEDFIQTFLQDKAAMMVYDMLTILELSIKQEDILPILKKWDERYSGQKLNWSFTQILSWLDTSTLSEEAKHRIKRTIGFFIAYQQIYNLEHQKALTGEQL